MYRIHITFSDGTWRVDTYGDRESFIAACSYEALQVALGGTKVFAAWRE